MEHVISEDGTLIAYERSGSGPPLILVHGAAADHTRWTPVLPALQPSFMVYAVDRRGRGGSGDSDHYAVEREFEDLAAVIEAIGGPVDLLGHSFGGLCAIGAALHTTHLKRLVLYEPLIPIKNQNRHSPETLAQLQALIEVGDRDGAVVTFAREIVRVPEPEIELLRSAADWESRRAAIHTVLRELQVTESRYRIDPQRLKTLTAPTLLLLGSDSPPSLHEGVETLRAILPNRRVAVMADQQHLAMNTAPELFAREVIRFLTSANAEPPAGRH
jgi:pimeloyl-ACP methyl ester carboxylesterase